MINIVKSFMAIWLSFALSTSALAAPKVSISMTAEKEITIEQDGKPVIKRVAVTSAEPGDEIIYTLTYTNNGTEKATDVTLNNPIPHHAQYVKQSAWGKGSRIEFSYDDGKTFAIPSHLIEVVTADDGKPVEKTVSHERYTHVLWKVREIPANSTGNVGFHISVN